jgi:ribosomal protein S1
VARKQGLETPSQVVLGQILDGTVVNVQEYGVFVALGGINGLLHRSRLRDKQGLSELYPRGRRVRVRVVSIDPRGRVGLALAGPDGER